MGAQNLFTLKLLGTKFVGIQKMVGTQICWYFLLIYYYSNSGTLSFVGTQKLWVHKICDDTKFQVSGREYQNICVR